MGRSMTYDRDVGLSHYTGQVTHHIAPDIDAERDGLINDLRAVKTVLAIYEVTGVGPTLNGRNGEGDRYYTDGEIKIARCSRARMISATAIVLDNPPLVKLKNEAWQPISAC